MFPTVSDDLSVAEAADALGTSPQTVRRLLRDGELSGRRQPWGSRFVWVPSRKGVGEFLSQHGRLDGRRREPPATVALPTVAPPAPPRPARRPWVLRPRGRATVGVAALGLPLLLASASARILPGALWFHELGQLEVLERVAVAKVELWLLVTVAAAPFAALNLFVALSRARVPRTRSVTLAVVAASLIGATTIASRAAAHWQTFMLWRHRQPFGVADPMSGKDVGFFVFSLPFQRLAAGWLLGIVAFAAVSAAVVYRGRGMLTLRAPHASAAAPPPPRRPGPAQPHVGAAPRERRGSRPPRHAGRRAAADPGVEVPPRAVRARAPPARQRLVRGRGIRRRPCPRAGPRGALDPVGGDGARVRGRAAHGRLALDRRPGRRSARRARLVRNLAPRARAAVRGRSEPAPQRAAVHRAVDRRDEERPRARGD